MLEQIKAALSTGQSIKIKYAGGSRPGDVREIKPSKITNDTVYAYDMEKGGVKGFKISKILPIDADYRLFKTEQFTTISEAVNFYQDTLVSLGWSIVASDTTFGLHAICKNGAIRKYPTICVDYDATYQDFDETGEVITKTRQKPWIIRAKNKKTANYKTLTTALEQFMSYADELK